MLALVVTPGTVEPKPAERVAAPAVVGSPAPPAAQSATVPSVNVSPATPAAVASCIACGCDHITRRARCDRIACRSRATGDPAHTAPRTHAGAHLNPFVRALATLGPAGYAPIAPATAGSALIALIGWFLPVPPLALTIVLLLLGTLIAVWVAGEAEKTLGHDAKPIVIDEAVGQSLALLFVPHVWWAFAAAFLLFRIFDIWKPLGANQAQNGCPEAGASSPTISSPA